MSAWSIGCGLFADALETLFDHVGRRADGARPPGRRSGRRTSRSDRRSLPGTAHGAGDRAGGERRPLQAGAARPPLPVAVRVGRAACRRTPVARVSPVCPAGGGGRHRSGWAARTQFCRRNGTPPTSTSSTPSIGHIDGAAKAGKRVVLACWSEGSRDRMGQVLVDHGLTRLKPVAELERGRRPRRRRRRARRARPRGQASRPTTSRSSASRTSSAIGSCVRTGASAAPADFLTDATSLAEGDLVVHIDHGIGRFDGLKTIEAAGAPHDCLEIHYAGGDRVYLPVENIELLSRYGSEETDVPLDKLGGVAWQARKARLKKRIRDMAEALIKIAAAARHAQRPGADAAGGALRRVRRPLPLRGDRGPGHRNRRRARRSRRRPADGPPDLRRRRLRQDRGRAPRRLRHGDDRQAGRRRRADHAARPPALQDLLDALCRPAGQRSARPRAWSVPRSLAEAKARHRRRHDRHRHRHPRAARQGDQVPRPRPAHRRRGAALRRQAQGAAEGAARPTSTC